MLYWVFDLDQTLYQLPENKGFDYKLLRNDEHLGYLLKKLPCKKLMYTNGTLGHASISIDRLSLNNIFHNIEARDTLNSMKPNTESVKRFILKNRVQVNDKCVFFDDMPENLISSKNHNWITVLIRKENCPHEYIDFWFPNIYVALNYFIFRIKEKL